MTGEPVRVQNGSVTVTAYPSPNNGYESWVVAWWVAGRRHRRRAKTREAAITLAEQVAEGLSTLSLDAGSIPPEHRTALLRAKHQLPGYDLGAVIDEYAEAKKLAPFIRLSEAVRCYLKHHPVLPNLETAEVVRLFLRARKDVGSRWAADLRNRLARFAKDLPRPIQDISRSDLSDWLNGLPGTLQTRRGYRSAVSAMFAWAKGRVVAHDWDLLSGIELTGKRPLRAVSVFTPSEMSLLIGAVPAGLLPYLAIAGFAGVRQSEIQRMEWRHVDLKRRIIMLDSDVTKTQRRRLIPIQRNLAAILKPLAAEGRVCKVADVNQALRKVALSVGVPWRQNALRHSYISYRLAVARNVQEVALEAGNSAAVILSSYRELVTIKDGKAWFAISRKSYPPGSMIRRAPTLPPPAPEPTPGDAASRSLTH